MNREIKFRGKRIDNGAWETGSAVVLRQGLRGEEWFIADKMTGYHTPVSRNTVGQYTGLKDRKGKEIFEGDILSVYDRQGHFNIIVKWDKEAMAFLACYCSGDQSPLSWFSPLLSETYKIKVIGNIYDNPELLEEGK